MPEPPNHSWLAGMPMPMLMPGGMTRAELRIAHDAQNGRRIGLQHISSKQLNAIAKDSQNSMLLALPCTSGRIRDDPGPGESRRSLSAERTRTGRETPPWHRDGRTG